MQKYFYILVAASVLIGAASGFSQIASDDASNYLSSWTDGSNEGSGFSAWSLTSNPGTGFAGFGLQDSTTGGSGNINTGGNSFHMYADPQGSGAFADAERSLSSILSVGYTLSVSMAVNFRNGNKGLDIRDSTSSNIFNFNVGSDDYVVNNASTGNGSLGIAYAADSVFDLSFTQTSASGGNWSIARQGSGAAGPFTGTYSGAVDSFKFYINETESGAANNLYFNNLSVVPEPSTLGLLSLGLLALARRRRPSNNQKQIN